MIQELRQQLLMKRIHGPLAVPQRMSVLARKFHLVEDGDRKGFQSNKGKAAKEEMKIASLTLPPRSPSLMPLGSESGDEEHVVLEE